MSTANTPFTVAVIGGGPAGLMAAEVLSRGGARVDLFDAMPSVGRKFLLAGIGGMNITHAETRPGFLQRYGTRQGAIAPLLQQFDAAALRAWVHDLGIETFVGSSGRVFPADMKAAPLLRAWLHRLRTQGVQFHTRHRWLGWGDAVPSALRFATPAGETLYRADAVVLALGGGSWAKLGSDGSWTALLQPHGVKIAALKPANCGFDVAWSAHFRERYSGQPVKPVTASAVDGAGNTLRDAHGGLCSHKGECIITDHGIEGGIIYSLAAPLRDHIATHGRAYLRLDLAPDRSLESVRAALEQPRGRNSLTNHLRKQLHIDGVKAGLLNEAGGARQSPDSVALSTAIKSLPIQLNSARPLDEAISSAGGICFETLDPQLMLQALPGVFCAGEMLDWEAPTGGYLLTACFASGFAAGKGVLAWRAAN